MKKTKRFFFSLSIVDATNILDIELIANNEDILEEAEDITAPKKHKTSEAVDDLVRTVAAAKLVESETESVTADSVTFPISKLSSSESVTSDPSRGKLSKSVTAGRPSRKIRNQDLIP